VGAYIAFLRAVNVAGHAVVKMDALCGAFTAVGCRNVRSFIQSGNVIFESSASESATLRSLRREIRNLLGQEPGIFLRTLKEIAQLVDRDPFKDFKAQRDVKLYVAFLASKPRVKPQFPLLLPKAGLEAFAMSGREVFIVSRPNPRGFTGNNFIEKELQVSATSRNWNTITKIVKFAERK
jgi:uncharacterized protein (DUF1697 family)